MHLNRNMSASASCRIKFISIILSASASGAKPVCAPIYLQGACSAVGHSVVRERASTLGFFPLIVACETQAFYQYPSVFRFRCFYFSLLVPPSKSSPLGGVKVFSTQARRQRCRSEWPAALAVLFCPCGIQIQMSVSLLLTPTRVLIVADAGCILIEIRSFSLI